MSGCLAPAFERTVHMSVFDAICGVHRRQAVCVSRLVLAGHGTLGR